MGHNTSQLLGPNQACYGKVYQSNIERVFVFLGEHHQLLNKQKAQRPECKQRILPSDWLSQFLGKHPHIKTELFLEVSPDDKLHVVDQSLYSIEQMRYRFLAYALRHKVIPNLKVHWCDIRGDGLTHQSYLARFLYSGPNSTGEGTTSWLDVLLKEANHHQQLKNYLQDFRVMWHVMQHYSGVVTQSKSFQPHAKAIQAMELFRTVLTERKVCKLGWKPDVAARRVTKEMQKCTVKKKLIKFSKQHLSLHTQKLVHSISDYCRVQSPESRSKLAPLIHSAAFQILCYQIDAYTLARMFHPRLQQDHLVISYFGALHTETQRSFLMSCFPQTEFFCSGAMNNGDPCVVNMKPIVAFIEQEIGKDQSTE